MDAMGDTCGIEIPIEVDNTVSKPPILLKPIVDNAADAMVPKTETLPLDTPLAKRATKVNALSEQSAFSLTIK
jgi:hypothetical protein